MPPRWSQPPVLPQISVTRWRCPSARLFASFRRTRARLPTPRLLPYGCQSFRFPSLRFLRDRKALTRAAGLLHSSHVSRAEYPERRNQCGVLSAVPPFPTAFCSCNRVRLSRNSLFRYAIAAIVAAGALSSCLRRLCRKTSTCRARPHQSGPRSQRAAFSSRWAWIRKKPFSPHSSTAGKCFARRAREGRITVSPRRNARRRARNSSSPAPTRSMRFLALAKKDAPQVVPGIAPVPGPTARSTCPTRSRRPSLSSAGSGRGSGAAYHLQPHRPVRRGGTGYPQAAGATVSSSSFPA